MKLRPPPLLRYSHAHSVRYSRGARGLEVEKHRFRADRGEWRAVAVREEPPPRGAETVTRRRQWDWMGRPVEAVWRARRPERAVRRDAEAALADRERLVAELAAADGAADGARAFAARAAPELSLIHI